ncbi:hypothetical protein [Uliginosibacterium sp. H1]|uniref:hypothetical protein n=1 Tax=Uliginosibacterium sp. H1 TaxID=3114757 RepID=UPI002E19AA29|nr:hypothetical protein [Uliginosibacterium sp. H1]
MSETQTLPGQIVFTLVFAAVLAYPLARLLLWRYVRAVEAAMRSTAPLQPASPAAAPAGAGSSPAAAPSAPPLLPAMMQRPWRAAAAQAIVACVLALWFAWLYLRADAIAVSPSRLLMLGITHLWPGILAVLLVAGITRRQRVRVLAGGSALYLVLGVLLSTQPLLPALVDALRLWLIVNLLPTLYLAAFLTRRVRSVGPPVLLVCLLTVSGAVALLAVLAVNEAWLHAIGGLLFTLGLGALGGLAVMALTGAALAAAVGVWLLHAIARGYAARRIGDQGLMLAALWLVFTLSYSVNLLFAGGGWFVLGLLAFPVWLLLSRLVNALLLHDDTGPAHALLLLRVFARKGNAPALFHALSRHWRHVGPIRMIAGYDLATESVEPDELMAFLRGRLADSFVTGPDVVDRRLGDAPPRRDADVRFRAEEFFCFDDTWRYTLQRLVATSAVVLMDLRGFGPQNRGCVFELAALAEYAALPRTVLLHDASTDMASLRAETTALGIAADALPLLALSGDEARDLPALVAATAKAAQSSAPSSGQR